MNYDLRIDTCRKLRGLECRRDGAENLKREIAESKEFTSEEINYLNGEIDKITEPMSKSANNSNIFEKYLPYLLTFMAGYGAKMLQDKAVCLIREGEDTARREFIEKIYEGNVLR